MMSVKNKASYLGTMGKIAECVIVIAFLSVAACEHAGMGNQAETSAPSHKSNPLYNPMVDAIPGDDRPTVPSVNDVSPAQADGNGESSVVIPEGVPARR